MGVARPPGWAWYPQFGPFVPTRAASEAAAFRPTLASVTSENPTFAAPQAEGPTTFSPMGEGPTFAVARAEGPTDFIPMAEGPTFVAGRAEGPTHVASMAEGPTLAFRMAEGPTMMWGGGEDSPTFAAAHAEVPTFAAADAESPTFWGGEGPDWATAGQPTIALPQAEDPAAGWGAASGGRVPLSPQQFGAPPGPGTPFGAFSPPAAAPPQQLQGMIVAHTRFATALTAGKGRRTASLINIEQLRNLGLVTGAEAVALTLLLAEADDGRSDLASLLADPAIATLVAPSASPLIQTMMQFMVTAARSEPQVRAPGAGAGGGGGGGAGAGRGRGGAAKGTWSQIAGGCLEGAIAGAIVGEAGGPWGSGAGALAGCIIGAGVTAFGAWGDGGFGGAGCFAANTLVLLADGTTCPIGEIKVGQNLLTISEAAHLSDDAACSSAVVEQVHRHDGDFQLFSVGGILSTATHPWAVGGDKKAGFLRTVELDASVQVRGCTREGARWLPTPQKFAHHQSLPTIFNLKTTARTFAVASSASGPFYVVHNKSDNDPFEGPRDPFGG